MPFATTRATLSRQWALLRQLPSRSPGITTAELVVRLKDAGFSISKRSIERDLNELSLIFPLERNDRSIPYGWYWAANACVELRGLSVSEALSLALVEEARMVVAGDEPQGLFSLGSLESTAAVRIPATLAEYNQRYPKIQFALATGPSGTMLDGVLDGTLNAAFVDGPITHPGLEGMPVYREEMMIVTPNGHPPIQRASDVNGCSIYAFRANCSYRRHFESWFHADRAMPGTIHEMESYHGMLACVIAGAGIALIPRSMLESMPGHHQVNAWPLSENWRWLNTWLVWRRGAMTRQLEAFIEVLNPQLSQSPE